VDLTEFTQPTFWLAALQIIWINVLLSGDNAVVIALACRSLPPRERMWGLLLGAGAAVVLRIFFTIIIAQLMGLPFLKLVGGLALLWIAVKLIVPEEEHGEDKIAAGENLWRAVRIVAIADIVMSLDNVIAVAAAAGGSVPLLVLGLAISIPLIVAGAALIMALLTRLPILVWLGAALLGWIAGDVIATDPAIEPKLAALFSGPFGTKLDSILTSINIAHGHSSEFVMAVLGLIIVLVVGGLWRKRALAKMAHPETAI